MLGCPGPKSTSWQTTDKPKFFHPRESKLCQSRRRIFWPVVCTCGVPNHLFHHISTHASERVALEESFRASSVIFLRSNARFAIDCYFAFYSSATFRGNFCNHVQLCAVGNPIDPESITHRFTHLRHFPHPYFGRMGNGSKVPTFRSESGLAMTRKRKQGAR